VTLPRRQLAPFWFATFIALSAIIFDGKSSVDITSLPFISVLTYEGKAIEVASFFLWLFATFTVIIWFTPKNSSGNWKLPFLFLFFAAREMDLDKTFFSVGLFKSRQYLGDSPFIKKIIGMAFVSLLACCCICLIRENYSELLRALRHGSAWAWTTLLGIGLVLIAKTIDGSARKLGRFGVEIEFSTIQIIATIEEILELIFASVAILAVCLYKHRFRVI